MMTHKEVNNGQRRVVDDFPQFSIKKINKNKQYMQWVLMSNHNICFIGAIRKKKKKKKKLQKKTYLRITSPRKKNKISCQTWFD